MIQWTPIDRKWQSNQKMGVWSLIVVGLFEFGKVTSPSGFPFSPVCLYNDTENCRGDLMPWEKEAGSSSAFCFCFSSESIRYLLWFFIKPINSAKTTSLEQAFLVTSVKWGWSVCLNKLLCPCLQLSQFFGSCLGSCYPWNSAQVPASEALGRLDQKWH